MSDQDGDPQNGFKTVTPDQIERLGDEELMTLVGHKNPIAFEVFYDRHGTAGYSVAYRIVGERPLAEDVLQEAFLSIWRSKAGFDRARGSVRAWVLGIVRNRAIDAVRRAAAPTWRLDCDDDAVLEDSEDGLRTEAEVLRRETARELRGALAELPREQSQVLEMAYFGGFSQSEIAAMMGMPLGTVKGRTRLGLEKIRGHLAEAGR